MLLWRPQNGEMTSCDVKVGPLICHNRHLGFLVIKNNKESVNCHKHVKTSSPSETMHFK